MDAEEKVRHERLDYGQFEAVATARDWLRARVPPGGRIRVVGDDDCDGATSAHVLSNAFARAGYRAETLLMPIHDAAQAHRAIQGPYDAFIIADAGSVLLPALDLYGVPILVVDHHNAPEYTGKNVHEVNPRRVGGDRTWGVSASVVASLLALSFDPANEDLAFAGAAGGISDRQHLGGFHGLLEYCVDRAVHAKTLERQVGFTLPGETTLDSVAGSFDPYFASYSGDPQATEAFVGSLGVQGTTEPSQLSDEAARDLSQRLEATLVRRGRPAERHYPFYGERLPLVGLDGVSTLFALSKLLEACTAAGEHSLALNVLAGDGGAIAHAKTIAHRRQERILGELRRLQDAVHEHPHLREAETHDAPDTGVYAHALLTYVYGDDRPLVVWARKGDTVKASVRGSPFLFLAGLDVSRAASIAARRIGGHGGGHPGAAGATVPASRAREFLEGLEQECAKLAGGAS